MPILKPWSQACENNKLPIAKILQIVLSDASTVLEIGSGTGQHAVYMGQQMPWLIWQTSDLLVNHAGIEMWINEAQLANVRPPLLLDVNEAQWMGNAQQFDAIFSANILHIMPWQSVVRMFEGLARYLSPAGRLCVYGPFNYGGKHTSASNARFDAWLREQNERQGIRHAEEVFELAMENGFTLQADYEMPSNNRLLHWQLT